ncbi:hypothetical protein D3C86_1854410 [compost metagenome]
MAVTILLHQVHAVEGLALALVHHFSLALGRAQAFHDGEIHGRALDGQLDDRDEARVHALQAL